MVSVTHLIYSPNSKYLASVLWDRQSKTNHILIFDMQQLTAVEIPTGNKFSTINWQECNMRFLANSAFLTLSDGNLIYFIDIQNSEITSCKTDHQSPIQDITFSRDGRSMATCSAEEIMIWHKSQKSAINEWEITQKINSGAVNVRFSPLGNYVTYYNLDKEQLTVLNSSEKAILTGQNEDISDESNVKSTHWLSPLLAFVTSRTRYITKLITG